MSWAQRLKRVFGIEIDSCARCGGKLEVIASIEEPEVIAKILVHLEKAAPDQPQVELPLDARAPSQASLLQVRSFCALDVRQVGRTGQVRAGVLVGGRRGRFAR